MNASSAIRFNANTDELFAAPLEFRSLTNVTSNFFLENMKQKTLREQHNTICSSGRPISSLIFAN
ncbi:hypothetical protein DPMN_130474 [Dreissena polymorpha]|uniref:Uncharacterized protein n=1 Tax=Dreissena polymorpha TaxID=45954 RepID=A0A9D4H7T3_DREPO|nr:hypothetical protein DPMN_130474 [Dreissena polymorpha]